MRHEDLTFVNLGRSAYYAVGPHGVLGVLYWSDPPEEIRQAWADEADEPPWGDDDPDDVFFWTWVSVHSPHSHYELPTPPLRAAMTQEQVEANREVATESLYRHLTGETSGS